MQPLGSWVFGIGGLRDQRVSGVRGSLRSEGLWDRARGRQRRSSAAGSFGERRVGVSRSGSRPDVASCSALSSVRSAPRVDRPYARPLFRLHEAGTACDAPRASAVRMLSPSRSLAGWCRTSNVSLGTVGAQGGSTRAQAARGWSGPGSHAVVGTGTQQASGRSMPQGAVRGTAVPIMQSRVTRAASCASPKPSLPAGRVGRTR